MSLWDTIVKDIKGVGSAIGGWATGIVAPVAGTAISGGASLASQQLAGTQSPDVVKQLQATTQQALTESKYKMVPGQASQDLLLQASKPVAEVISKGINRPLSTVGLLTDPNSPLFQQGQYGAGFQLSDVVAAYNRSAKVSPFQAATKSSIFQDSPLGIAADALLKKGNINLDKVNLWDDNDIKKNFVDNPVGKWFTGTGDFILSNAALGGVTALTKTLASTALKATNLTTSITSAEDLARLDALADSHITHVSSKGLIGTKTVFGADVEQLANSSDMNLIVDKVRDYSNNEMLPRLIAKTTNPAIVKDMILADKGYIPALERLGKTNPADLWELGDVNNFVKGNVAATGTLPRFEGTALENALKAFDQAIAESPAHKALYDAFLTPEGELKNLGNAYKPVDPKFFGEQIGAARTRIDAVKAATVTRDYYGVGGATETVLGSGINRPITALIRFVGTQKPRGYITFSGARPFDGVDELNAMFDDIRMFTNGEKQIVTGFKESEGTTYNDVVKVSEYRQKAITDFMNAQTASERAAVIDELDKNMGRHIAWTLGIKDTNLIDDFIQRARNILNTTHQSLGRDGFAFDTQGRRIVVDPQTQRQLADSIPMLPWGKIERDMLATVKTLGGVRENAPGFAHTLFETLNKIFSISVLGRPAYIPKNSMAEPLISSFLSMGHKYLEDSIGTASGNFVKNNTNRILSGAAKVADKKTLDTLSTNVKNKMDKLNEAIQYRDSVYAEYVKAFEPDALSPATVRDHLDTIKANLRAAESLVTKIETEANIAAKQFGKVEEVPSIYGLRRRIDFLKAQELPTMPSVEFKPAGAKNITIREDVIAAAERLYAKAIAGVNELTPNIAEHNASIEKAWKLIDKAVADAKLTAKEQADFISKREALKKRYYGKQGPRTINVGGKDMQVEDLFDKNKFGDALRSEFSNEDTQELNYLGELRVGQKVGALSRKGPSGTVDINDPVYFEELAYVVNRQLRGDPLVDMVLKGTTEDNIVEWANSKPGISYLKQFGLEAKSDLRSIIEDRINFVKRMLPNDAAREYASEGPVTSIGLQKILADKLDILSPIHPTDIDYGSAATMGRLGIFTNNAQDLMNAGWKKMASAENPFRWLWADKRFTQVIEKKLNLLHEQGVSITAEQANAVRQASYREALNDAEKVFYTIRRQNRALYAARTIAAFPSASANALYRFGRLGIKYPARMAGFMRNYYGLYNSFGVDKNGNPVDDVTKAEYIVIPGTKELGLYGDQGIRLSTKAFGFLANMPGPSWLSTMAIGRITDKHPDKAKMLKRIVDDTIGSIPGMSYDNLFPQGVSPEVGARFIPTWVSDLNKYLTGSDSNADFYKTHQMVWQYQMTLWEMKLGPKPTFEGSIKETKNWYLERAKWRFASPFGIAPKQDKPGQLFQDYATMLLKKHNGDSDAAQIEMMNRLGTKFPADRYLYRGQTKNAYIAPTYEGYDRVWISNKDLAAQLEKISPTVVGLLTADITGDPDPQVQKYLATKSTNLPGGDALNAKAITVQQYEDNLQLNRTWNTYRAAKDSVLEQLRKATGNPNARIADYPEVKSQWDNYVAQLGQYNKDWWTEYNANATGNSAFMMAKGMQEIVDNQKFWQKNKDNDFWQQVQTFLSYRDKVVQAYNSPEAAAAKAKGAIQKAWVTYLQNDTNKTWTPQLQQIIDRYFINDNLVSTNPIVKKVIK